MKATTLRSVIPSSTVVNVSAIASWNAAPHLAHRIPVTALEQGPLGSGQPVAQDTDDDVVEGVLALDGPLPKCSR